MKEVSRELFDYAVAVRRQLHMYPEVGFDLPRTVELVKKELTDMDIPFTERYGRSSVVAWIGNRENVPTLAIRADMDALPVQEKVDVPFRSRIDGQMHACGHDSHTAVLLAVARALKERESELPCNIRLFFQPSEEGTVSGAKMMVDNGVMDGVDAVVCTHSDNDLDVGFIGVHPGDYMAACVPMTIRFFGRTAHAAMPHMGIDAVAMGVEAYTELKKMVAKEAEDRPYIWCNGHFSGGEVHNVIPDLCTMDISFRMYDMAFAERVMEKTQKICDRIAESYGGRVEIQWLMSTCAVHNDEDMQEHFNQIVSQVVPLTEMPRRMTSEDFAWYLTKKPGVIFRFGTRNEKKGCTALAHRNDFCMDEEGMKSAILAFVNFALRYKHKEG